MQSKEIIAVCSEVKVKVVTIHAIKAYGGSRSIAPLILNLDSRRR